MNSVLKNITATVLNQSKQTQEAINDSLNNNVVSFQKKMIQQNPVNSMNFHWQVAQLRKNFIFMCTLPFVISESFWSTWTNVYSAGGK